MICILGLNHSKYVGCILFYNHRIVDNILQINNVSTPPLTQEPQAAETTEWIKLAIDEGFDEEKAIRKSRIDNGVSSEVTTTYLDWKGYKTQGTIYGEVRSLEASRR